MHAHNVTMSEFHLQYHRRRKRAFLQQFFRFLSELGWRHRTCHSVEFSALFGPETSRQYWNGWMISIAIFVDEAGKVLVFHSPAHESWTAQ